MKHKVSVSGAFPTATMPLSFPPGHMMAQSAPHFPMNLIAKTSPLKLLFRVVTMNTWSEFFQSDIPQKRNQGVLRPLYPAQKGVNPTTNALLSVDKGAAFGVVRREELSLEIELSCS